MIREVALAEVGLLSVAEAAVKLEAAERTVQKWILNGLLPVVVAGGGMRTVYLLRITDVKAFTKPPMGRPKEVKEPVAKKGKPKK